MGTSDGAEDGGRALLEELPTLARWFDEEPRLELQSLIERVTALVERKWRPEHFETPAPAPPPPPPPPPLSGSAGGELPARRSRAEMAAATAAATKHQASERLKQARQGLSSFGSKLETIGKEAKQKLEKQKMERSSRNSKSS